MVIIIPDKFSGYMRDNQTYPTNHPADRYTGRCDQGGADNNNEPDSPGIYPPHRSGLIIPPRVSTFIRHLKRSKGTRPMVMGITANFTSLIFVPAKLPISQ